MSDRKQKELQRFVDDFLMHKYQLKKSSLGDGYFYKKGKHCVYISVHHDRYEIAVGYYWDFDITVDAPFTYDSRLGSWSDNRGFKLPVNRYPLLLKKVHDQMKEFMPKILPNDGWKLLHQHLEEQMKVKITPSKEVLEKEKAKKQVEEMKRQIVLEMKTLELRIKTSLSAKSNSIETEHYLEKLLQDMKDLSGLLKNTQHIEEKRLYALIEEGLQVIQNKYQEVAAEIGRLEEHAIRRKLYLIQERKENKKR